LPQPHQLVPTPVSETEIRVTIPPDSPADWPAGTYNLSAIVTLPGSPNILHASNELPLSVMPVIGSVTPNPAARAGNGNVTLTVNFTPRARAGQRVSLLIGDREGQAVPPTGSVSSMSITVPQVAVGQNFVRLRVDGVDSSIIVHGSKPPQFDNTKRVQIT
jgi:hypothetical protein